MARKFIDNNALLYIFTKIKNNFVAKESGKGLSSNDYTTLEKEKLAGIAEGANKTVVEDVLTSTSATNALSANQGKELLAKINAINTGMEELGAGDMLKSVYDVDGDGLVDKANDSNKLGGFAAADYAKKSDIPTVTNDLTDALKGNYDAAYTHSQSAHAPSDAEKNTIVSVKVNGAAVSPDTDRAVDITVPTKVSDLTNDSGFLTEHQDISGKADKATTLAGYGIDNAYTKDETDEAIATAVASASHLKRTIVDTLPETGEDNVVYMVLEDSASSDNKYIEWMYLNGAWEKTGDTTVDLTDYMKTTDMVALTNEEIDEIYNNA